MSPRKRSRSSSISSSDSQPRKRQRSSSDGSEPDKRLKVYIVQAKLSADEVASLYALVDHHSVNESLDFELTPSPRDADVIVTAVHMRKRLERHIDWALAKEKPIVTPDWLFNSVSAGELLPCGKFAALSELHDETVHNCPDGDDDSDTAASSPPTDSLLHLRSPSQEPAASADLDWKSRYACCRASPLVCVNQHLVSRLAIIRRSRELEDDKISALSYDHAIGMIKSYPYELTEDRLNEVNSLPHIGPKMISRIEEYLDNGDIEEAETIANSQRYQSLEAFTDLYGVGATTARKLYAAGCRTFEDVERYYGVSYEDEAEEEADLDDGLKTEETDDLHLASQHNDRASQHNDRKPPRPLRFAKPKIPSITPRVALDLRDDLDQRIPREEVQEIFAVIVRELNAVRPGCVATIVGGYRRGKSLSGDVDIVIGHPNLSPTGKQVKGLSSRLVERLYERGLVTHLMYLSGFHAPDVTRAAHWDALEKALTVFVLPGGVRRRVDLIFAAPEAYWTAVVGWTGSKTFERDLRRWAAEQKELKFDSTGLTRRSNGELLVPTSEEDVFRLLGLGWVPPTLRNADA